MSKITFLSLFRKYIEYYREPDLIDEAKSAATIKNYSVKYNNVSKFLYEQKLMKLKADQFNMVLANKLVNWIKKDKSHDYGVRTAEICECVLNFGYKNGIIDKNPLYAMSFKKKKPAPPVFLTPNEIELIEKYEGPFKEIADTFLFQCYTGLDYTDVMNITKTDIVTNPADKRNYIIKPRKKTGIEAYIPYYKTTADLWSKYDYQFKKVCNQRYNAALKLIAKEVGITKRITSHIGRKTFTMIKLNYESYSMEAVSKMVGHASVKTTESFYAQVKLNLISNELNKVGAVTA